MALTNTQLATLKADILANSDMNMKPMTNGASYEIADLYNAPSSTDVWRTDAGVNAISDEIDFSKYTATDAADGTAIYTNRQLLLQTKQMNLQILLQGRSMVDASKANVRAALRNAVIDLPSGESGADVDAGGSGGVDVLNALARKATRFELLFSTSAVTTGAVSANLLVLEGHLSSDDVQAAREMS